MSAFVIADTHWGHRKSLGFYRADGERLRPFDSVEQMDELMVQNWNRTVNPGDTVYHLGDVVIPNSSLEVLNRLNGKKILCAGNHDVVNAKRLLQYFSDVRGAYFHRGSSTMLGGLIFTHVPVHPSCISGHYLGNVHGHLHCNRILAEDGQPDRRYFNACVELHDFTPVPLERIYEHFRQR